MTEQSSNSTAEQSFAEQTGSSTLKIPLTMRQLRLIRWSMAVASNTIVDQAGISLPKKEVVNINNQIDDLERYLYDEVSDKVPDQSSKYEQLTLF